MRAVIQRVSKASVTINNKVKSSIESGLLVLLGIEDADRDEDIEWLSSKIVNLRIFADENGVMNKSLKDIDGEKYIKFISTVKPRVVPTRKIKYLVTTRLEKYRKYTEKWLKKNNIQYEQLIMMDLPSKAERVKLGNHGKFKGEQYKRLEDAILFIESNERQAPVIADVSGKDVFCVDNGKFYKPVIVEQPPIVQPIEPQIQKERKARKIFRKIVPLKVRKGLKKLYKRK